MSIQKLELSWDDCAQLHRELADRIPTGKYHHLIAIARGGMVPTFALSKLLDIPAVSCVAITSYAEPGKQGKLIWHETPGVAIVPEDFDPETTLIVDDIVDNGTTIQALRELLPGAHLATVFARGKSKHLAQYTVRVEEDWVQFPWDRDVGDV